MAEKMTLDQAMYAVADKCANDETAWAAWLQVHAHLAQPAQAVDVGAIRSARALIDHVVHGEVDMQQGLAEAHDKLTRALSSEMWPVIVREVMDEMEKAIRKFPAWPTDPLHAVGVFNEEAGELAKAVLQQVYEPHKNKPGDVRSEAVQAAAMALRFLASIDTYDWAPGKQHEQPNLTVTDQQPRSTP